MSKLNTEVPLAKLNDGHQIPMLSYGTGTALYQGYGNTVLDSDTVGYIKMAIGQGYMHLDGAEVYGTEPELGKAIKESKVPREKLFVTTKVLNNIDDIPGAIEQSLQKLGLDYVDLYLIHSPFFKAADDADRKTKLQAYWKQMEAVQASGKARSIGVSNYLQHHLEATLETAKVVPAVNQIELHPYLQHGGLLDFLAAKGIVACAFGPITPATKAKPGPLDGLLAGLAKKYYVNEAEICLRWCIDKGAVAVTTSTKEQRLSDYMRVTAFKLTPREIDDIDRLGGEKHFRGFWSKEFAPDDRS